MTTAGCNYTIGDCGRRVPDGKTVAMNYTQLCDGRRDCPDARAYDKPGVGCGGKFGGTDRFTMIIYQCEPGPTGTTTIYQPIAQTYK